MARLLTPTVPARTVKRPRQVIATIATTRLGGEQASAATHTQPSVQGSLAAAGAAGRRWWEQAEFAPRPAKRGGEPLDAAKLIMSEVGAAKHRGAIQLTANATVGASLIIPSRVPSLV